jgi:NAD(P)-binding Rossmann-like domain
LAHSHGGAIRSTWHRPGHAARFATASLNPVTRRSFEKLQLELDEEPYSPRDKTNPHARNIAVLGGGITGLATAFELSRTVPGAKITIYEAAKRLGGWMDSEIVPVDDGEVVFEWGPRTLRHTDDGSGVATVNLVCSRETCLSITDPSLPSLDGPSPNGAAHRGHVRAFPSSSQPLHLLS